MDIEKNQDLHATASPLLALAKAFGILTGTGVSNVFDGERDLGGGLVIRGVGRRPSVGLLSQLEALRYVSVGSYFKRPERPIWVIASESHFSVLFGLSSDVQGHTALELSLIHI